MLPISASAMAGASAVGSALDFAANKYFYDRSERFNERMANTAWQRGVADMRRAGINPLMAVSKGGAASPGMPPTSGGTHFSDAPSSAVAMVRQRAETEQINNLARKTGAEAKMAELLVDRFEKYGGAWFGASGDSLERIIKRLSEIGSSSAPSVNADEDASSSWWQKLLLSPQGRQELRDLLKKWRKK